MTTKMYSAAVAVVLICTLAVNAWVMTAVLQMPPAFVTIVMAVATPILLLAGAYGLKLRVPTADQRHAKEGHS